MNNTTSTKRTTNRHLLAELQELRSDVSQLKTHLRRSNTATHSGKSPLPPYTIPEDDCRYLSESEGERFLPLTLTLRDGEDTTRFCEQHFYSLRTRGLQEEFHVVTLNGSHRVIRTHQITIGLANQTQVHPREVFRPALLDAATAIVLVHNHPSGDVTPSASDVAVTEAMVAAGKILGIKVLDHIILGRINCLSFTESGRYADALS